MILDTSAVAAIFFKEPAHEQLVQKIVDAPTVGIGSPTLVECGIVISARLGQDARGLLARFEQETGLITIPFSHAHTHLAIGAWLTYGKGRHRAQLNYGDCVAYATAKLATQPLLCIGNDFAQTDLALA